MRITLPIYHIQRFNRKESKKLLIGMSWYRNTNYYTTNSVKQHYHNLVKKQLDSEKPIITGTFKLVIQLYYQNSASDGSNICSIMEKFVLDALQEAHVIVNDNLNYHLGTKWEVIEQDKLNPRVEIILEPILD